MDAGTSMSACSRFLDRVFAHICKCSDLSWNGWCGENSCGSGSEAGCGGREQSLVLDSLGSAVVKYFHNAARGEGSAED